MCENYLFLAADITDLHKQQQQDNASKKKLVNNNNKASNQEAPTNGAKPLTDYFVMKAKK
jgi:hypothetical protein